mmetsp:Transcript_2061/g.2806  ORF Transcript_2061/g.2806 Transcript_2061/m.2806 type:complete len:326 (+) Transcript_2061:386-1363(+)
MTNTRFPSSSSSMLLCLVVTATFLVVESFQSTRMIFPTTTTATEITHSKIYSHNYKNPENDDNKVNPTGSSNHDNERRQFLSSTLASFITTCTILNQPKPSYADIEGVVTPSFLKDPDVTATSTSTTNNNKEGVLLYTTKSGLRYIELKEGNGPSPKYGNLVSISYKAFIKLPESSKLSKNSNLQEYDTDNAYLIKHGNGRIIPGLDEGLHTMKVGGKRRIIIPPKLGYVGPGVLGPLPESPYGRYKLNNLLDEMIAVRGGNVVFDVELKSVIVDEADQGYYEDDSISPEDFNTLRLNMQQNNKSQRDENDGGSGSGFDFFNEVE